MSCAGCDDCPQDAWHLHVTVRPHWSWSIRDVASALERDIRRHEIHPVVVTNEFWRSPLRNYKEIIPTKHLRGTETEASREIFRMGILLNNAGWRVKRLKIEGDARRVPQGRALYYESHVKPAQCQCAIEPLLPVSTNAKGERIYTARREHLLDLNLLLDIVLPHTQLRRIEAAVLDTNPDLDAEWINQ